MLKQEHCIYCALCVLYRNVSVQGRLPQRLGVKECSKGKVVQETPQNITYRLLLLPIVPTPGMEAKSPWLKPLHTSDTGPRSIMILKCPECLPPED